MAGHPHRAHSVEPSSRRSGPGADGGGERYRELVDNLAVTILEHDFRDVKRALVELRASGVSDVRRYLAEHPDFVDRLRRLTRITDINATGLRLFGVRHKEDFFRNLSDFLPASDDSFEGCLIAIDEEHPVFTSESRMHTASGRVVATMFAISFPAGHDWSGITASVLDVTERVELRAAVERTRAELDRALRAASLGEATASVAHEMKQPLAAVVSSLQASRRWLRRGADAWRQAEDAVDEALAAAQQAVEVVNRVRKLMGTSAPDHLPLPIDQVVLDAVRTFRREAEARTIPIRLDLRAGGTELLGDRVLLGQLLVNLLANAFQAMARDRTAADAVLVTTTVGDEEVVVQVIDTGPGLPAEGERIFESFVSTEPGGMGLGLAISRSVAELHGGSISADANPDGRGARFQVVLPLDPLRIGSAGARV